MRIAKEWVNEYSEMPVSVRRLFKHTHLNTACRLLGVSALSLEFLPERDASLSDADAEDGDESAKGWTGSGGKKPMVEDLEAARESHAAQDRAEAAAAAAGAAGAPEAGSEPIEVKGPPPVNGRKAKAEVGTPKQVVHVGVEAAGGPGAARGKGGNGKPVKTVPFAVLRGPEVEQERWEVRMYVCALFVGGVVIVSGRARLVVFDSYVRFPRPVMVVLSDLVLLEAALCGSDNASGRRSNCCSSADYS